jgi:hypothetical protein
MEGKDNFHTLEEAALRSEGVWVFYGIPKRNIAILYSSLTGR